MDNEVYLPLIDVNDPNNVLGNGQNYTAAVNFNDALLLLAIACAPAPGSPYSQQLSWTLAKYFGIWDPIYRQATPLPHTLRINAGLADLDPHQKTVLSDDFGVALALALLDVQFGVLGVADCFAAQKAGILTLQTAGKHRKMPDFILLLATQLQGSNVVLLECKGSQVPGSHTGQLTSACTNQLGNVSALAGIAAAAVPRVAIAAQLPHGKDASLHVSDPPEWIDGLDRLPEYLRASFVARELAMIGKFAAASSIWTDMGFDGWEFGIDDQADAQADLEGSTETVIQTSRGPMKATIDWATRPSPSMRNIVTSGRWPDARAAHRGIRPAGRREIVAEDQAFPQDDALRDFRSSGRISIGSELDLTVRLA
ncbi:MAG: hypothetical protein KDB68_13540 [Planctomycetes bacterium]|nr:hypothetical protein [Planctomycetota bacterium]